MQQLPWAPCDVQAASADSVLALERKVVSAGGEDVADGLSRPLVFTNGVFDILHRGHVTYLAAARAMGASLIVAINTDRSVKMLGKGDDRPYNHETDRALVLAGLASVDRVVFFADRTPCDLVRDVRPDIYVKGGDYDMDMLEEARIVRGWGGQANAIPFVPGYSTTALLARARQS